MVSNYKDELRKIYRWLYARLTRPVLQLCCSYDQFTGTPGELYLFFGVQMCFLRFFTLAQCKGPCSILGPVYMEVG